MPFGAKEDFFPNCCESGDSETLGCPADSQSPNGVAFREIPVAKMSHCGYIIGSLTSF